MIKSKLDILVFSLFAIIIYYFLNISNDGFAYISLSKNILNFDFYTIGNSIEVKYPLSYPIYLTFFIELFDTRFSLIFSCLILYYIFFRQIYFFTRSNFKSLIISLFFFQTFSNVGSESLFIVLILYVFILLKKESKNYFLLCFIILTLLETKYISLSIVPFVFFYFFKKKLYSPILLVLLTLIIWSFTKFIFLGTITGDGRVENTDSFIDILLHFFHLFDINNIYYSFIILILFVILILKFDFKFDSYFITFIIFYCSLLFYSRITTSFDMISPRFLSIVLILIMLTFKFKSKTPFIILFCTYLIFFAASDFKLGEDFFKAQKDLSKYKYERIISGNKYLNEFSKNFFQSDIYEKNSDGKIIYLISNKNKDRITLKFRNSNIKIILN